MKKFNNPEIAIDLKKMKSFNIPIQVKSLFVPHRKRTYGIDVSKSAYFYTSEIERNEDLKRIIRKIK